MRVSVTRTTRASFAERTFCTNCFFFQLLNGNCSRGERNFLILGNLAYGASLLVFAAIMPDGFQDMKLADGEIQLRAAQRLLLDRENILKYIDK